MPAETSRPVRRGPQSNEMARDETPWRIYLTEDQLLDTDASIDLNKLCWYCQQLCVKSKVLNDLRWHQPFQVHMRTSSRRNLLARFLTRSEDQNTAKEQVKIIDRPSLGSNRNHCYEHLSFHPNGESLLSSAQAGCHLCSMLCWTVKFCGQSDFFNVSQSCRVIVDQDKFKFPGKETHYTLTLQNDAMGDLLSGQFFRLFHLHNQLPKGLSLPLEI